VVVREAVPNPVHVGSSFHLTLVIQNRGTEDAWSPRVRILLPKQLQARATDVYGGALGGACDGKRRVTCDLGPVDACGINCALPPVEIQLLAAAVKAGTGRIRIVAGSNRKDTRPTDNRKTIRIQVRRGQARADLAVSVEPRGQAVGGIPARFLLAVQNRGPDAADELTVNVDLASGGRFVGSERPDAFPLECVPADESGRAAVCRLSFLPRKRSARALLVAVLAPGTARVTVAAHSAAREPTPSNDVVTIAPIVVPPARTADLGVTVEPPERMTVGEAATYAVKVTNHGPDPATAVSAGTVTFLEGADPSPDETKVLSTTGGVCYEEIPLCELDTVRPGETITITASATVSGAGLAHLVGFVKGSDDAYDPGRWEPTPPGHPNGAEAVVVVAAPAAAKHSPAGRIAR